MQQNRVKESVSQALCLCVGIRALIITHSIDEQLRTNRAARLCGSGAVCCVGLPIRTFRFDCMRLKTEALLCVLCGTKIDKIVTIEAINEHKAIDAAQCSIQRRCKTVRLVIVSVNKYCPVRIERAPSNCTCKLQLAIVSKASPNTTLITTITKQQPGS